MNKITIDEYTLSNILNNYCSCGGRGPKDDPCDACAIWHEIIACKTEDLADKDFLREKQNKKRKL